MPVSETDFGKVVEIAPLPSGLSGIKKSPLVATDRIKVIQLDLPADKVLPEHQAPGNITVHCLVGSIEFTSGGVSKTMRAGQLLYLPVGELHAVRAIEDSTVLLTIAAAVDK